MSWHRIHVNYYHNTRICIIHFSAPHICYLKINIIESWVVWHNKYWPSTIHLSYTPGTTCYVHVTCPWCIQCPCMHMLCVMYMLHFMHISFMHDVMYTYYVVRDITSYKHVSLYKLRVRYWCLLTQNQTLTWRFYVHDDIYHRTSFSSACRYFIIAQPLHRVQKW